MPWIETTDDASLSPFMNAQNLDPQVRDAHRRLYEAVMEEASVLSRAEREAIAVVVSELNGSAY